MQDTSKYENAVKEFLELCMERNHSSSFTAKSEPLVPTDLRNALAPRKATSTSYPTFYCRLIDQ